MAEADKQRQRMGRSMASLWLPARPCGAAKAARWRAGGSSALCASPLVQLFRVVQQSPDERADKNYRSRRIDNIQIDLPADFNFNLFGMWPTIDSPSELTPRFLSVPWKMLHYRGSRLTNALDAIAYRLHILIGTLAVRGRVGKTSPARPWRAEVTLKYAFQPPPQWSCSL